MAKKFTRKIENFVCENCEEKVRGRGYTNHCPRCLWSKHVDINPGDRQCICKGAMRPLRAYYAKGRWKIVHVCEKCNHEGEIFADQQDDIDEIMKLSVASLKG